MKKFLMLVVMSLVFALMFAGQNIYAASEKEPPISGKVVETMNSGGYTYVQLEKNGKKTWVATMEIKVKKGQEMSFKPGSEMTDFESKTLKRKFDRIIFSDGPISQGGAASKPETSGSKTKVVAAAEKIKVEKASGANAYTVAELYQKKAGLEKKNVVIKGKVVKVSVGIMKKNWIHIQDGSGDAKKGTHNLVVTSQDVPAVGDTVTVNGTLYNNKDFGSGYKYDLIVEDAKIKK